jgi:hypothetical protein
MADQTGRRSDCRVSLIRRRSQQHSGGYRDTGLSNLSFLWVVEKARGIGHAFDDAFVAEITHPKHTGVLRESMMLGYRTLGQYVRPVLATADKESVHESALHRNKDHTLNYRPETLPS